MAQDQPGLSERGSGQAGDWAPVHAEGAGDGPGGEQEGLHQADAAGISGRAGLALDAGPPVAPEGRQRGDHDRAKARGGGQAADESG